MTIKLFGGVAKNCGIGVVAVKGIDIEVHQGFEANNCGIGVAQYASAEELRVLQEGAKEHLQKIIDLTEQLKQTPTENREEVVKKSALFEALAASSNASTVMQFLISNVPAISSFFK
ncbi:hypothetical protein [Enterobacter bugandensis]|uniref:hypothetical protein n=1 Tax=Enterobacter bugandensis TaxID=881260 RepID=UPI00200685C3|nr:hypothetical protein [Enterobacter bugandensis]MCK7087850.1 hypothetical protein [Enterobacter bugandensis]HCM9497767.1 hypothetical protein [Enterobacter asburiae]